VSAANKRNFQLDVLRGVAILLVTGRHVHMPHPSGVIGAFADLWYRIGWLGVDLFFVLSGFLIGGLLLTELDRHGRIDVPRFLVRRGLKIYPLYFAFIAYLVLMPTAKALVGGGDGWATFAEGCKVYWPNLLFLQSYVYTPAGHLWSLAVEEHFYLLLPFGLVLLAAMGRHRLLVPLCLFAVPACLALRCVSVWIDYPFSPTLSATHLRIDALLFGVGIRGLAQYSPAVFAAARKWRRALLVAGVLLWLPFCFINTETILVWTLGLTGSFLGSAAFLLATYHTHKSDFAQCARYVSLLASLVAWIGFYSYSIYIWHMTAIGFVEREFCGRVLAWMGSQTPLGWLVGMLVTCMGTILAGVVAGKVVEWPVLRLRDRLFPSRSGALPAASASRQESTGPERLCPGALGGSDELTAGAATTQESATQERLGQRVSDASGELMPGTKSEC
jgi:peptidoglycan/LPS O-acetylase OafA/YrhL